MNEGSASPRSIFCAIQLHGLRSSVLFSCWLTPRSRIRGDPYVNLITKYWQDLVEVARLALSI